MKKILLSAAGVSALALSSFAFVGNGNGNSNGNGNGQGNGNQDNRGRCVSSCARQAADRRRSCESQNSQQMQACLARADEWASNCKNSCPSGDDDDDR